ncbi:PTS sugar transporter subunit IIB [Caldinitratiruptor microaerophilus]|uniref:PTS ascorbate transporter subunit IIB n=1 Tax=Caldinitratiruptor microaerophilus TaxID=671077 RepID=A0AA35CJH1_9FIRM|nr:PTS sugar transporter subunit IIB [Caldinitratiruptor microaerophilus]BDG59604.1 PTS ascorbate transporter subunit IIB [Caldinitratiruptor microaerophilus]
MKILAVCGLGQGTSLILRMNIEDVLRELGVDAEVDHMDVSAAAAEKADMIVASPQLAPLLAGHKAKVVVVNSYLNKAEIKKAIQENL